MTPNEIVIVIDDKLGQRTLEGKELLEYFDLVKNSEVGEIHGYECECYPNSANFEWAKFDNYEVVEIRREPSFFCRMAYKGISVDCRMTFLPTDDGVLAYHAGSHPRFDAVYVDVSGPNGVTPPKAMMTRDELDAWVKALEEQEYSVSVTVSPASTDDDESGGAHMDLHDALPLDVAGQSVQVDKGVYDLVAWMNRLPGVATWTSCQGGCPEMCSQEGFIGVRVTDESSLRQIKEMCSPLGPIDDESNGHYFIKITDPNCLPEFNQQKFGRPSP